jgi:hypothetical protein
MGRLFVRAILSRYCGTARPHEVANTNCSSEGNAKFNQGSDNSFTVRDSTSKFKPSMMKVTELKLGKVPVAVAGI